MKPILEVISLTKTFPGSFLWKKLGRNKSTTAVCGVNFTINPGEIVGLLGPNGAGKTTTIQMLLGTTSTTRGQIKYFGQDFSKHRSEVLKQINYASAYTKLPWHLTVKENLMVYAVMYEVPHPMARITKLLHQFDMTNHLNSPMRSLSAGQTTRVILTKAFLNYPKLILLDEPTASLDPESAAKVREFIIKQRQEYQVAMLFTSHNMTEVAEVCDRVLFIQHGKIVDEDTPEKLAGQINQVTIRLLLANQQQKTITCKETEISQKLQQLAKQQVNYTKISIDKPTLEDYFIKKSQEKL